MIGVTQAAPGVRRVQLRPKQRRQLVAPVRPASNGQISQQPQPLVAVQSRVRVAIAQVRWSEEAQANLRQAFSPQLSSEPRL